MLVKLISEMTKEKKKALHEIFFSYQEKHIILIAVSSTSYLDISRTNIQTNYWESSGPLILERYLQWLHPWHLFPTPLKPEHNHCSTATAATVCTPRAFYLTLPLYISGYPVLSFSLRNKRTKNLKY